MKRVPKHLSAIPLCIFILLVSGCLGTITTPVGSGNASDNPLSGTSLPATPVVIITPNASNAGMDTRVYPPHHPPTVFIFTLPEAIDVLGEPVFIPMELPPGYAYGGGSVNTDGIVSLGITNGNTGIAYLQVSPPRPIQGTLQGSSIPISSDGINGICTSNGSQHQFSWSDGTRDYYLSGALPCQEYVTMAASLGLLTSESLEIVPWNELQPATPLPPSEILNLVFSREWLDSHDTNPDPQIFNVTMTMEEFNSSFAPDREDPTLLRQAEVKDDAPVALLNMPKDMFARFNDDPSKVKINFPDTFFRFYDSMDALHDDLYNRRAGNPSLGNGQATETPARTIPSVIPTTPRIS